MSTRKTFYSQLPISLSNTLLLVLCSFLSFGQDPNKGEIRGIVKDQKELGLPYIIVWLDSADNVVTNEKGEFVFKNVSFGSHTLSVTAMAYESYFKTIDLNKKRVETTITLNESSTELEQVTVSHRIKSAEERVKEQAFAVDSKEVEKFKNSTKDINQVLNQMQGVRIRETGGMGSRYNLSLNGLSGRQVRYFVDGIPVDQLGSSFNLNNLSVNLVERLDVYKGVVPVNLGADALGGAINILTNKKVNSYLDASYSIGSFNTHRAAIIGKYRFNNGFTVNSSGYFNYSDNNYKMQDMPVFIKGKEHRKEIRRFHDQYQSGMASAEAGFTNVKWADELMAGISIANITQDIQSGIYGTPVGEAKEEEDNKTFTLKFNKSNLLDDKVSLNAFLLYNTVNSTSIDTSSNRYDWSGTIIRSENNALGELVREKTIFDYTQSQLLYRINARYDIHQNHTFNLNYISSDIAREGRNQMNSVDNEAFGSPNTLKKAITGIAYETRLIEDRLTTILSLKHYNLDIHARDAIKFSDGTFEIEDIRTDQTHFGYSFASRYFVNENLYLKASFEKGYRLPEPREIFGDGLRILASPKLKPESSFNSNLGMNYRFELGRSVFQTDLNVFQRDVKNFIFMQQYGVFSLYKNVMKVLARGIEAELIYSYKKRFAVNTNFTWQNILNNEKYTTGTKTKSQQYKDRMPNTPYLFANMTASFELPEVIKNARFSVFYGMSYVHSFFLNYSSVATSGDKNNIPRQFLNDLGLTYSSKEKRINLTVEIRNLFDHRAYDNYKLQKPGRSFHLKLRHFISKK